MEETLKSHWYLPYDQVIIKAQAIQPYFAADIQQFTMVDPWFTSDVNTELLSNIYLGLKDFSESSLIEEIKWLKILQDAIFTDAVLCYENLNYFVDLGFKNETLSTKTFGYSGLAKARHSVKKMIDLLNYVHSAILDPVNETRLIEVGMPHALVLEVANVAAELASIHGELKILKKQYLLLTQERIGLYNSIWEIISKITQAAKIIFANDAERLAIYNLYDTGDLNTNMKEFMHLN